MATEDTPSDTGPGPSRATTYLRALKVPVTFVLVAIALVAAYYSIYVRNSLDYLKGRDLRILATLGSQIQTSLDDHERVLTSFSTYYHGRRFADEFRCIVRETAGRSIAMFAYVAPDEPAAAPGRDAECPASVQPDKSATDSPRVRARFIDKAGTAWTRSDGASPPPTSVVPFRVDLDRLLAPLFTHHVGDEVFDALVLATPSGRVIYSQGAPDLRLTSLDGLLRRQPDGNWKEQPFAGVGRASQVLDVQISGGQYVLYLQPCCTNLSDPTHAEKDPGWIVAGLVDSGKLRKTSLAVSFSVMAFTGGLILLAIFSWPFLKLALVAREQRLRLIDVLVVGMCSLLGVALVMLFLVDWIAYGRLKADLSRQLADLSGEIQHNVGEEIAAAYDQIRVLDAWTPAASSDDRVSNVFDKGAGKREDAAYPFFESFALIAADGRQLHKWAVADFTTPLVSTTTREYFRHWLDHDVPDAQGAPDAPADARRENAYAHTFLESIRSATTGRKEAVLSTPTRRHQDVTVAALTIPMISLTEVALPPGFKFAVIDADGNVMFHSDSRHTLDEQFFLEADSSRRLRSAVAARRNEDLNIRYFGEDYRAYVAPLASINGSTWSLVTLFDRQLLRTVNIEWIVTTMLFVVIYAAFYIVLCIVVLLVRPAYRAPWIWPDPARREDYEHLIGVYAVFALAFAIGMYGLRGRQLLVLGWILPFIVWMATYLVLTRTRAPASPFRWPLFAGAIVACLVLLVLTLDAGLVGGLAVLMAIAGVLLTRAPYRITLPRPYTSAAVLLGMLTAVLPSLAFFEVAHAIQVDSYVKYGQLTLARAVQRGQAGGARRLEDRPRALEREWSRYGDFFYHSQIVDATEASRIEPVCGPTSAASGAARQDPRYELPRGLEDYLPYYSESSVGMRELLHDRSSDRSWDWHRDGATLVLHTPPGAGWTTACVRSQLPRLMAGLGSVDTAVTFAKLTGVGAMLLLTVSWVVRFVTRRIFLIDVIEPLWARRAAAIPVHPGEHLYIVWRPPDRKARALVEDGMHVVDLEAATEPSAQWLVTQRDLLEQLPSGQTVVIDHLDARAGDPAFDAQKLVLVRDALDVQHRTVVLVSALRPSSLVARIGAAATPESIASSQRWTSVLSRFTVLEGVRFEGPAVEPATVSAVAAAATVAPAAAATAQPAAPAPLRSIDRRAASPDADPVANAVWNEVVEMAGGPPQTPLDSEQIFEEVGDRLDSYHRGIWEGCSDAQKLVLQHLAEEGLINEKNRRTVRLLLARGLIRKDPNFRFASETFRRYVLWRVPPSEVAAIEERSTSPWDAVRLPFLITLLTVSAFFFLTQRELFTTTVAVITALAGGIPAIVRVAGLFERHSDRPPA